MDGEREVRCAGCGSPWTNADLANEKAKNPKILSCCPERQPLTIDEWMVRADENGTPAARWRAEGKPDPTPQDYERAELPLGQYTDDELANAAYLQVGRIPEHISNAAKQRMRWLSRRLCEAEGIASEREKYLADLQREFGHRPDEKAGERWCVFQDHTLIIAHPERAPRCYKRGCGGTYYEIVPDHL